MTNSWASVSNLRHKNTEADIHIKNDNSNKKGKFCSYLTTTITAALIKLQQEKSGTPKWATE